MTWKSLWRGVLIVVLSVALATPATAQSRLQTQADHIVIGVVAGIAGAVILTLVLIHYSKRRSITGCVVMEGNGMSLNDEKDKQSYTLGGDTSGIKPGERMKLEGRKEKSKGSGQTLVWETKTVTKDFGVCKP
jgi:hypothetical protein